MKWKLIKARQGDEDDEQQMSAAKTKKKKKTTSSNSSPSSSSSSSSFSISHLLPLSWLASRLRTTKRSTTAHYRSTTNVCPSTSSPPPSPALPRRPPEPNSGHPSSAHLVFCHASVFPPARLAPRVAATPEVPDRRSHDDEGASRPRGAADARAVSRRRRRHHRSVGDLDLTLGHLIPFSVRSRAMYSDSGIDGSASGRQCRRRRRESHKARPPSETDNRDGALRRRSFGDRMRRRRARAKVRVVSPRTPKPPVAAAATRRRRRGEEAAKATRELEGFAVVKRSQDPQRDFRESMVEMIWEKGIGRPEELESLLACYLFLNAHEHHDVIVKVFRQLWFELDPDRFACCYH